MNEKRRNEGAGRRGQRVRLLAGLVLTAAVAGCTVTQKEAPVLKGGKCALIPAEICAQLTPGTADEAGLRYIAPGVKWSQYTKVMVAPVTVWDNETQDLSHAEQQVLANYLYNVVVKSLGAKFTLVDEPGPGVLHLQLALTDAEAATPALRTVSMAIPQARVLATAKYVFTGTYPFVGNAQGEAVVTDSVTGKVLAAGVDRRVGGGSVETAVQWQWGDAENAMNAWAALITGRLEKLRAS